MSKITDFILEKVEHIAAVYSLSLDEQEHLEALLMKGPSLDLETLDFIARHPMPNAAPYVVRAMRSAGTYPISD